MIIQKNNKKGLSSVVATLLIILLAMVLIVIVWVIIKGNIKDQSDEISLDKFTVNLKISDAKIIDDTHLNTKIIRNVGEGDIYGVYFVVHDIHDSEVARYNISMKELEEKKFEITLYVLNASEARKITLAPIIKLNSGKEVVGSINDEFLLIRNEGSGSSGSSGGSGSSGSGGSGSGSSGSGGSTPTPTCTETCSSLDYECGTHLICDEEENCGTCGNGYVCNNNGKCVEESTCVPTTCEELERVCGEASDGCGKALTCGICNDNNLCTEDSCSQNGKCVYSSTSCDDNNECTTDVCDPSTGCSHASLTGISCKEDNNPCTTDICNNGLCTHIPISDCCTSDSNCISNPLIPNFCPQQVCNLSDNKCYSNYPSCANNDGCCPLGCNLGNDNDCTTCTRNSQCNDNNVCTTDTCVSGTCTFTPITQCINNDGCCPTGCNAVNDNNCNPKCGNGVREGSEQCDGLQLGSATCVSLLGSGYTSGSLTCTSGCIYNVSNCCSPESNTQFCSRLTRQCGSVTANDNCGNSRTVSSCGTCQSGYTCSNGLCIQSCVPESNAQFCSRLGKNCGSVTGVDNCQASRTANCGSCSSPLTCGGSGTANVCGCTPTTYTPALNTFCDSRSVTTNCGTTVTMSGTLTCQTGYSCAANGTCVKDSANLKYIVQNGVGYADIIVASNAPNTVKLAANYFQMYIQNMTGVKLPISNTINNSKQYHVYIGKSTYTDSLGINSNECKDGGFKIISGNNYLALIGEDTVFSLNGPRTMTEWDNYVRNKWGESFKWGNDLIGCGPQYNDMYGFSNADKRGSMNAVFEFLYNQGIRWYYPGWHEYDNLGTIIPSKQSVGFGNMNTLKNPDYPMRSFSLYGYSFWGISDYHLGHLAPEVMQWVLSLRTNSWYEYTVGSLCGPAHGLHALVERQWDKTDYFAVVDGVRQNGNSYPSVNLCYPYYTSQNRLFEETVKYVKTMYDAYNLSVVNIMPLDGIGGPSDECAHLINNHGGYGGLYSNYVWEFVNNVAWEIYNDPQYAGKMVECSAYTTYSLPPTNLSKQIAPNLAVSIGVSRDSLGDFATKAEFENYVNLWTTKLASNNHLTGGVETNYFYSGDVLMHHFYDNPKRNTPVYMPNLIADNLRLLKGKSYGDFLEINTALASAASNEGYNPNTRKWNLAWDGFVSDSFNTYITALMYWDVNQNVSAIMDEYYTLYYGPAASKMKEAIEYSENNYATLAYSPIYLKTLRQKVNEALAMVPANSKYAQRITLLRTLIYLDYAGDEILIDSCRTLDSEGTTYKLTRDVSSARTCMTIDQSGITLDCQGHSITYSTAGGSNDHAIHNDAFNSYRGDYFTLKNCVIKDGSYLSGSETGSAIYLSHIDNSVFENNIINVSGEGIYNLNGGENLFKGNNVTAYNGNAYYSQIQMPWSRNIFINNIFKSDRATAAYMYDGRGENITSNQFISNRGFGLHLNLGSSPWIQNNLLSSQTTSGFAAYDVTNVTKIGNTEINNGG